MAVITDRFQRLWRPARRTSTARFVMVTLVLLAGCARLPIPQGGHPSPPLPPDAVTARLITAVSSRTSRAGDAVEAVTLGVPGLGNPSLPAGCRLLGTVSEVERRSRADRASLTLRFDRVRTATGVDVPITARVVEIDNAREEVDETGRVLGLRPLRAVPSKKVDLLMLAAYAHPAIIASVEAVRVEVGRGEHPEVSFAAGTEIDLIVGRPATPPACTSPPVSYLRESLEAAEVARAQPLRTEAGQPPRPADWINLVLVGSRDTVERAFTAAGWLPAVRASLRADVRTFMAVITHEGYQTGPVSLLTLNGTAPALVFQRQTNTFAKRHHVRIWPGAASARGDVWIAAATHDIGVEVSETTHHFTHRIDGQLDDERLQVVRDLAASGWLDRYALIPRREVPRESVNAAGDSTVTDGRAAVLFMRTTSALAASQ